MTDDHPSEKDKAAPDEATVPIYDVDRIIQAAPREGSGWHGPEGTSLILAEAIKREYAMIAVFSDTIANAHLSGDLHIENLGDIDRPTTMIGSVDFIRRFGVGLPGGFAGSRPARRPEVLAAHLVRYTAALHGYFSAAIAWDSVNFALAPLVVGLEASEMKQVAQGLLFELSAPAIARGGQPIRCDLHLDWDVPAYQRELPAVGAGGEKLDLPYHSFSDAARTFLKAIFEVYLEGDAHGLPFTEPRPILHVTNGLLEHPEGREFLDLAIQVAVERGGLVLAFDRSGNDEAISAFTARYGVNGGSESWQWRAAIFSSVAINLPRIGYRAGGDRVRVFELLTELLELAAQASLEKRVFLEKLLARGEAGPLALLAMRPDKEPFLPLSRTAHAICPIGLAELSEAVCGNRLDSSLDAQKFATQVVRHLHTEAGRLSAKHKVRFVLTESQDIVAAHRLARLDLKTLGRSGSEDAGNVYYTNGARLPISSSITAFDRSRIESAIQQGKILNATVDVWLGGSRPGREHLAALVSRVFRETQASALSFSPEFTVCLSCRAVSTGLVTECTLCGSNRIDGLAQVTDRFSRTSIWPRWKLAELKLRNREQP